MNKGFTLLELLVVVLIIGILAAIALPQYQKAVERSRMAEAVQVLGDLGTAQSIFFMQHNAFATGLPQLNQKGDVNIPDSVSDSWVLAVGNADGVQTMTRRGGLFDGGILQLTVGESGAVRKECFPPDGHPEFCAMAEKAGYQEAEIEEEAEAAAEEEEEAAAAEKEVAMDEEKSFKTEEKVITLPPPGIIDKKISYEAKDTFPVEVAVTPAPELEAEAQEAVAAEVAEVEKAVVAEEKEIAEAVELKKAVAEEKVQEVYYK